MSTDNKYSNEEVMQMEADIAERKDSLPHVKLKELLAKHDQLTLQFRIILAAKDEIISEMNKNCISLLLHESRMKANNARIAELEQENALLTRKLALLEEQRNTWVKIGIEGKEGFSVDLSIQNMNKELEQIGGESE